MSHFIVKYLIGYANVSELNKLIAKLEKRTPESSYEIVLAQPSLDLPPSDAPLWAVRSTEPVEKFVFVIYVIMV